MLKWGHYSGANFFEYQQIDSKLVIESELWDTSASKAIGRSSKIASFNKRIEDMRHVLKEHPTAATKAKSM